jgi:hypothetical protein
MNQSPIAAAPTIGKAVQRIGRTLEKTGQAMREQAAGCAGVDPRRALRLDAYALILLSGASIAEAIDTLLAPADVVASRRDAAAVPEVQPVTPESAAARLQEISRESDEFTAEVRARIVALGERAKLSIKRNAAEAALLKGEGTEAAARELERLYARAEIEQREITAELDQLTAHAAAEQKRRVLELTGTFLEGAGLGTPHKF